MRERPGITDIKVLTSLRGIAAAIVFLFHVGPLAFPASPAPFPERGYLAVDLFFLLSGFVLAHVYGREFALGCTAESYGRFLWARFARLFPVHLFVILMLLPLLGSQREFSGTALLASLTMLQAPLFLHMTWDLGSWSMSAEWYAYLVFPLLVRLMMHDQRVAGRLALVSFVALIVIVNKSGTANIVGGPAVLLRSLPEFIIGIAVYRIYASERAKAMFARDGIALFSLAALAWLAAFATSDILVIAALPLVLLAVASNDGFLRPVFECAPLQWLGRISYSLYLVPTVLAVWLPETGHPVLVHVAGAFLLSAAISHVLEYPARAVLRSLPALLARKRLARPVTG